VVGARRPVGGRPTGHRPLSAPKTKFPNEPSNRDLTIEKTLINGIRHDTLQAIETGEKLLREVESNVGKEAETLRDATDHLVEHLKKELERWERKYKKAKVEAGRNGA